MRVTGPDIMAPSYEPERTLATAEAAARPCLRERVQILGERSGIKKWLLTPFPFLTSIITGVADWQDEAFRLTSLAPFLVLFRRNNSRFQCSPPKSIASCTGLEKIRSSNASIGRLPYRLASTSRNFKSLRFAVSTRFPNVVARTLP